MAAEEAPAFVSGRTRMVDDQLRGRGIVDPRVLAVMGRVPRQAFFGQPDAGLAYADAAMPIDAGQSISQPYIVARMTELLAPEPGQRVLEIGTGSGYQAAILAELGCRVLSLERIPELAATATRILHDLGYDEAVEVRVADGSLGDAGGAPWPRILVAAAAPYVPAALRDQLDPAEGRLVLPVGSRGRQELTLVIRHDDTWTERGEGACVFVPLVGAAGFATG